MIRHYLTLEHVAHALTEQLHNAELVEVFTQEKSLLMMRFLAGDAEVTVEARIDPTFGTMLIRPDVHRARKNTLDVFGMVIGQRCSVVTKHPHDRVVSIWLDRHVIHVLLFGAGKANVIVTKLGLVVAVLQKSDHAIGSEFTLDGTTAPPLGRWYSAQSTVVDDVIAACRASTAYFVLEKDGDVLFSLIPLNGWQEILCTDDIFQAIRRTISLRRRRADEARRKTTLVREITRRLHRTQRSLEAMLREEATVDRAAMYRRMADALMALPDVKRIGIDTIDVVDVDGQPLTVDLDVSLNIVENAAKYYKRAKRSEQAAAVRRVRIPIFQAQTEQLQHDLDEALATSNVTEQTKVYLPMESTSPDGTAGRTQFREFILDDSYTLYVGRSASNNDELTMRFAKQNDWWLHARGVSGSHVVLRGSGNAKPPKNILEKAAAIAAWYSAARNATYTPVVYTQRKYVRKPKGANVGAVTLEREQVILVKPGLP